MNHYRVIYIFKPYEQVFTLDIEAKNATIAASTALKTFKKQAGPHAQDDYKWLHKSTTVIASQLRMAL